MYKDSGVGIQSTPDARRINQTGLQTVTYTNRYDSIACIKMTYKHKKYSQAERQLLFK